MFRYNFSFKYKKKVLVPGIVRSDSNLKKLTEKKIIARKPDATNICRKLWAK